MTHVFVAAMASPGLRAVRLYRMDLPDHACPWGLRTVRLLAAHGVATKLQVFAGDER